MCVLHQQGKLQKLLFLLPKEMVKRIHRWVETLGATESEARENMTQYSDRNK